ncbi:MAG: hypothetical protein J6T73_04570, partial [Clostridia bacterium]|nr:hypothetical protein [Clostridia bacterium]
FADELTHSEIINALENGDFYASRGPLIKSLCYEDGYFNIECSPAKEIVVSNSGRREPEISVKRSDAADITSAQFPISDLDIFVRFTVVDENGDTANTRAYWREEFENSKPATKIRFRRIADVK